MLPHTRIIDAQKYKKLNRVAKFCTISFQDLTFRLLLHLLIVKPQNTSKL